MNGERDLLSDLKLDIEFLENLKDRKIDQKFFYTTEEAAKLYYQCTEVDGPYCSEDVKDFNNKDFLSFFYNNIKKQKNNLEFISLGCGNAKIEKFILENATKYGYDISYIGVDSSKEMIVLAERNLKDSKFRKEFICADFNDYNFRTEINFLVSKRTTKLFCLFGGTVGNIIPSSIADTLSNILRKNDLLWIGIFLREGLTKEDDFEIFKRFIEYQKIPVVKNHCFCPFSYINIPFKSGKLIMIMDEEKTVGALKFTFSFEFLEKTITNFRGERIVFLPKEKVELFNMRAYDADTFKKFFIEHGLNCVGFKKKGSLGQFLFKKL